MEVWHHGVILGALAGMLFFCLAYKRNVFRIADELVIPAALFLARDSSAIILTVKFMGIQQVSGGQSNSPTRKASDTPSRSMTASKIFF